jgi:hypothetical protein
MKKKSLHFLLLFALLVPWAANAQETVTIGTSGWKYLSFRTDCGAITTFPWSENFESYANGDFTDPCWVNEHIDGSGTDIFKVYTSSVAGNNTHKLQLPDMAIGTLTKLVLPEMTLPQNYEFSIDIYRSSNTYNDNYPNEGIRVYASTNGEIEGATELAFIPRHYQISSDVIPAEATTGWYTYELPIGMSGTCYIILRGESQDCTSTFMDNLTVKPMSSCPKLTGLTVTQNSIYAHGATITWTENGEASEWIVEYATDNEFTDIQSETVNDNPTYTFQGLDPETTYYVRVKAHCGPNDESEYSNTIHFTTFVACPAPTGLTVNPDNYNAMVNWTGTSDNYIVSYRTAAYSEGIVEHFDASDIPSGWTRWRGLVNDVINGTATLSSMSSTTSGWSTNSYALGQYNMKVNIGGKNSRYWLVTPEFTVSQDLNFDLALTDSGNANPIEDPTAQADDRFVVLIYANNAWTILREWNNSGSSYVYNTISTTGEPVTIGLSAYYGQDVKIAFYGESTAIGGNNDLHIDNVICGIPYEAGEWQTVTVDEATATIIGLTPETDYEVKVQGDCGIDGLSLETSIVSFTTLEACLVPQNVEVDDITYNSATVNWDGYSDSYIVRYRMAALKMANTGGDNDLHIDNVVIGNPQFIPATDWQIVTTTESPVILTGLTPETPYEVQVQGFCDGEPTEWSMTQLFTTLEQTIFTQTFELASGINWFSTYIEITLDDLKSALRVALSSTHSIEIKAQDGKTATWEGHLWHGQLRTLDLAQMYKITVDEDCEIEFEGMLIDPAEHPITIVNGTNWIGYPLNENMTVDNAFVGFAVNGDVIKSVADGQATWNGQLWGGQLKNLLPGSGYIYISNESEDRIFIFPSDK